MKINSVNLKIIYVTVVALIIVVVFSIFISIASQTKGLLKVTEISLSIHAKLLYKTINNELKNDLDLTKLQEILNEYEDIQEFREVSLLNTDGKNLFTNNEYDNFKNNKKPILNILKSTKEIEFYYPFENSIVVSDDIVIGLTYIRVSLSTIANHTNQSKIVLTVFFISIGTIFALILFLILGKIVLKPIYAINNTIVDINNGVFDSRIDIKSKDEFGNLAGFINNFIENFKNILQNIKSISNKSKDVGNYLSEIATENSASTEEISAIIMSSKENIDMLNKKIKESVSSVQHIVSSIEKITLSIDNQSTSVNQSSASIEEMAMSIENMKTIIENKKNFTDNLSQTAKSGFNMMEESIESINMISRSTNNMLEMIEVINNIAEQTDLLAMNAAIEAAHAGDSGKGFAVVADEIRKLAEITTVNAKSIGSALRKTVEDIHTATDINKSTGEKFNDLVNGIKDILSFMEEISDGMRELTIGSREIVKAINTLMEMTEDIKIHSEEINSNSKNIGDNIVEVSDFSLQTSTGIEEVSKGAIQIASSMINLTEVGKENEEIIGSLVKVLEKFKI